ncbi:uncharacterized protein LOC116127972 isoform X3 [Pistacia vera]|uniref:uncharacterized protein LOC116127972 isoform X3 n=1 Tax=Pistacia vera TaxID=55513 RepID=UPI0012638797|nr:uncharacterized protein LOC116127972 isoform X3 [Pistacia vera]
MNSQGTRVDIESGRLHGRRDVSAACLISFICNCKGFELLFNPKKRALAALFAILEAISFYLDRFVESRLSIRIVACLLSVLGLLVIVWTLFMERNSMANRVVAKKVLWALEIGFGVAQLINSFMILMKKVLIRMASKTVFRQLNFCVIQMRLMNVRIFQILQMRSVNIRILQILLTR